MGQSLRYRECAACAERGHRCQAQVWEGDRPLCWPCAAGEPCVYERVGKPARDEPIDPCCVVLPRTLRPKAQPVETVHKPVMGKVEKVALLSELEARTVEEVATRHGLQPQVVTAIWLEAAQAATGICRNPPQRRSRYDVGMERLAWVVCERMGLDAKEVLGATHRLRATRGRQILCYIAMKEMGRSSTEVGHFLKRHHTTVLYARDVIREGIKKDNGLRNTVDALVTELFLGEREDFRNSQAAENESMAMVEEEVLRAS